MRVRGTKLLAGILSAGALLVSGGGLAAASSSASGSRTVGGSTALGPSRVAAEFSMYLANIAANEEEPATPAQVRAHARAMHMSCAAPRFGQYACSSDVPERNNSNQIVVVKQRCVAVLATSGQVATGRCADPGVKVAPIVSPGYVDCARVGKVVTVHDPIGDQTAGPSRHPIPTSARRNADLTTVRIAATAQDFCVDFETTRPFTRNWTLRVGIQGQPESGSFAPSISQVRASVPGLYVSEPSAIAGEIGFDGDWTSLVIPAKTSAQPLPTGPFVFAASAEYEVDLPTGGYSILDGTASARYP